jgi:hypothetical protein
VRPYHKLDGCTSEIYICGGWEVEYKITIDSVSGESHLSHSYLVLLAGPHMIRKTRGLSKFSS